MSQVKLPSKRKKNFFFASKTRDDFSRETSFENSKIRKKRKKKKLCRAMVGAKEK
jgi:hypothetical protein